MLPRLKLSVTKCDQIAKAPFVKYYHKLVLSIYLGPKEMTLSYIVNFFAIWDDVKNWKCV
jgi:hypothetical protein